MPDPIDPVEAAEAEAVLTELARVFFHNSTPQAAPLPLKSPNLAARYRVLLDQIPAVVFMAYLDEGISEAYVSPQIEAALGFSQKEWLEDPVRWYKHIHPDDKDRWSTEAAGMFLSGKPLRSAYRVIARDGRVVWFHCEARLVRQEDGRPWFIHGVGFDITELKQTEAALQEERNVVSALFETVGALVAVLDRGGRIARFNRACEQTTGYTLAEVRGKHVWDVFLLPEDRERFQANLERLRSGATGGEWESQWLTRTGERRLISWSSTVLTNAAGEVEHIIQTGIDITERKRLEKALLDISAREQRRIGQDLHDGLGQHLTGVAFMSRVLQDRLAGTAPEEAAEAAKIVAHINDAIQKTRELSRGLLPVVSEAHGLMSALDRWAEEVSDLFHVSCRFQCDGAAPIHNPAIADHLYRIAQEAINNAIKHGRSKRIKIHLSARGGNGVLRIDDNGSGFHPGASGDPGLGLRIMNYRAKMVGGSLEIESRPGAGTVVICRFPLEGRETEERKGDGS